MFDSFKVKKAIKKLSKLNADAIANEFDELGIKGWQSSNRYCPLAKYFRLFVVNDSEVSVSADTITLYSGYAEKEFNTPTNLKSFIVNFDVGDYPSLILV